MSKISLTNLVNLQNETTAVNAINANNAAITTALDNTLSRDGTTPNTMGASLDMNSNQILNLPSPSTANSPARLVDISSTLTPTPAILSGNNVYTGNNSFTGTTTLGTVIGGSTTFTNPTITGAKYTAANLTSTYSSSHVLYAADYGVSTSNSDNGTAINTLIGMLGSTGGTIKLPPGIINYTTSILFNGISGITVEGPSEGNTAGSTASSCLMYNGGLNAANSIVIENCATIKFKNLQIVLPQSSPFNNFLVSITSGSALCSVENCLIAGGGTGSACLGVNLDASIETTISDCSFTSLATAINGRASSSSYSGNVRILRCQFTNTTGVPIKSCAGSWLIDACVFENNAAGEASGIIVFNTVPFNCLTVTNNWFGDVTTTGGEWLDISGVSLVFTGNYVSSNSVSGTNGLVLNGVTGAVIKGNNFTGLGTGIGISATSSGVDLEPNYYLSNTNNITGLSNIAGYGSYNFLSNGMLIQYGTATVTIGTPLVVTFSKAFTATPVSVQLTLNGPTAGTNTAYASSVGATSMSINAVGTAGTETVYWTAIGTGH